MEETSITRTLLAEFYATHREELVETTTRLLRGDRMTAEDMVQAAFLKLLAPAMAICSSTLPALVSTILRRQVLDLWRRRQHEHEHEHYVKMHANGTVSGEDIFSVCSARQITELLERRMARMDTQQARILRMNLYEGKPVSEISQETGIKYKSVEYQLSLARKQLRRYIG
ncbi:MAG: sigma-70 family RNA polymerase sigma factor [Prevotella sp.]|nr:sigma-70 family RNA polymerase sigma factor [Prevotella sp.]